MPFTPTHTLAALPIALLWSRHGTFSALVIGTMVPDWPLYVPSSFSYELTHSLVGLFTACLPIGFSIAVFHHLVLKAALFELLPDGLKARVIRYVDAPSILRPVTLLAIAAAVVVAAASHVAWDSFTHRGAWGVTAIPWLGETLFSADGVDIKVFMVLQHGFTLVGFPVFLLIFIAWYRRAHALPLPAPLLSPMAKQLWRIILVGIPAGFLLATALEFALAPTLNEAARLLVNGVTRAGFVALVLLACYALFFALTSRQSGIEDVRP